MPGESHNASTLSLIEAELSTTKDLGFLAISRIIGPTASALRSAVVGAGKLEDTMAEFGKKSVTVEAQALAGSSAREYFKSYLKSDMSEVFFDIVVTALKDNWKGIAAFGLVSTILAVITDPLGSITSIKSLFWEAEKGMEATIVMAGHAVEGVANVVHKGGELASAGYAATKKAVMSAEEELAHLRKAVNFDAAKYYEPIGKGYHHAYEYSKQYYQPAPPPPYHPKYYAPDPSLVRDYHPSEYQGYDPAMHAG